MKSIFVAAILIACLAIGCTPSEQSANSEAGNPQDAIKIALAKENPAGAYGVMNLNQSAAISAVLKQPEAFEGKAVRIEGTIAEVCPKKGCWIDVRGSEGEKIRVKVNDGEIVFPLSSNGHQTTVEGVVERIELTETQAKNWKAHEAEEKGETFDPQSVTGPMTICLIKGSVAEIK